MTKNEEETIHRLYDLMNDIRNENKQFREDLNKQVDACTEKVNKKVEPVYLEQGIVQVAKQSIQKAIVETFSGYNNPLGTLIKSVTQSHYNELKEIVNTCLEEAIHTDDFKKTLVDEFSHKVARTLISKNDGMLEKVCNDLKQDATFRSKLTLAIDNVVSECTKENKNE